MFDRLPAWLRHFLILVFLAPLVLFVSLLAAQIVAGGGIDGFAWGDEAYAALNTAIVTIASGLLSWIALYVTPLTRQYGVGSGNGSTVVGAHTDTVEQPAIPQSWVANSDESGTDGVTL